ncbi:MAG: dTDP-4-dehydrorhamnose 3,5-epimerase [Bacteroidota bacterium]
MPFIPTAIPDVKLFEPKVWEDERGYFFESYNRRILLEAGITNNFVQDNQALSSRGVLRGLHYQLPPFGQAKLVRVLEGEVLDVAVDIREGSPTFGQHVSAVLSAENKRQLFVPKGFAHGYLVLSETAVFFYKCDNYYHPEAEAGVRYDDPQINIDWPLDPNQLILSTKDQAQPLLGDHKVYASTPLATK